MSTPPTVELPDGAIVEWWPARAGHRAVLHHGFGGTDGEWVVLVPGFTGSKEDFIGLIPHLEAYDIAVLSYDQLGQHESSSSATDADYTLDLLAADLAAVVEEACRRLGRSSPPHLVGHSFGGLVAQRAIIDGLQVSSFTALCTGPGAIPEHRWQGLPDLVDALTGPDGGPGADMAWVWEAMRERGRHAGDPPPSADVEAFLVTRWLGTSPVHLRTVGSVLMQQPSLEQALIARSDVPMSVIWGQSDDVWPIADQRAWAERIGARAVEIPGAGHSPNADSPDLLVDALLGGWRG